LAVSFAKLPELLRLNAASVRKLAGRKFVT
jgi:hypothetical protein